MNGSGFLALSTSRTYRFAPYGIVCALLVSLLFFGVFWSTNDDAMMAMIAHGYGISSAPSPALVYSNVVWGWLLSHVQPLFGAQPYTLANYLVLALSLLGLIVAFDRARVPSPAGAALLLAAYGPVVSSMEFTLVAGYAAAAGVALVVVAAREGYRRLWIAAGLLLVLGSLIRGLEFLFVLMVAAPSLVIHVQRGAASLERKRFLVLAFTVAAVLVGCHLLDVWYYSSPEWALFNDISSIRRQFTDYGLDTYFARHPEILQGSKLSPNDIDLISDWFFADPTVFNSVQFHQVMQHVAWSDRIHINLARYHRLLSPFYHPQTLFFTLTFLLLLPLSTKPWRLLGSCGLFLLAMLAFLALGRPGILRVYTPVFFVLCVLALLHVRKGLLAYVLPAAGGLGLIAGIVLISPAYARGPEIETGMANVRDGICTLPRDKPMVIWGVGPRFRYTYVYRPFSPMGGECGFRFYPMGVLELAAPVLDQLHATTGQPGFVDALRAGTQFYVFTSDDRVEMLRTYFREHYGAELGAQLLKKGPGYTMYVVGLPR